MKRAISIATAVVFVVMLTGCASLWWPKSFAYDAQPQWITVPVRSSISYDDAWEEVLDVMAKRFFDLEMISKEGGYIRSGWLYTWWKQGRVTENYRVRTMIKFSPDKTRVGIRTEAQYNQSAEWIVGTDKRLTEVLRADIAGVVGR